MIIENTEFEGLHISKLDKKKITEDILQGFIVLKNLKIWVY